MGKVTLQQEESIFVDNENFYFFYLVHDKKTITN